MADFYYGYVLVAFRIWKAESKYNNVLSYQIGALPMYIIQVFSSTYQQPWN